MDADQQREGQSQGVYLRFRGGPMDTKRIMVPDGEIPDQVVISGECLGGSIIGEVDGKTISSRVMVAAYLPQVEKDTLGDTVMACVHTLQVEVHDMNNYVALKRFISDIKVATNTMADEQVTLTEIVQANGTADQQQG